MLSTRTLVFTNRTVSFTCCSTTWAEDVKSPNEDEEPPWTYAPGTAYDFRSFLPDVQEQLSHQKIVRTRRVDEATPDLLFQIWTQLVDSMSSRNLTFEKDILFAVSGVMSVLQTLFNVNAIYGLPERRLEQFLFWSPVEPRCLRRRCDMNGNALYSSWSWVGWVGETSWTEHNASPFGDDVQEIEWLGLSDIASEPVTLQCSGRGTASDDIALATELQDDTRRVQTLDFPILVFETRTAALRISTGVDRPWWTNKLQYSAWGLTQNAGKMGSGVYSITNYHDASHAVGSVILDSAEAVFEFENGVVVFAIISSSTYQDRLLREDRKRTFHRVLALRRRGDMFERIGHGAVLAGEADGVAWRREVILLI